MPDDMQELPDEVVRNIERAKAEEQEVVADLDDFDKILQRADENYFLAWETVELPSKGVYYDGKIPGGKLKVRPMSIDVDKMMANQRIAQSGELLNKIVEACVEMPDEMTIYDFLAGDQFFLLYYLRGITHGPDYEFALECPHCKTTSTYEYDLAELSSTVKNPNPDYLDEPMAVQLPVLSSKMSQSIEALVRLVRVRDISAMGKSKDDDIFDPIRMGKARNKGKKQSKSKKVDASDTYTSSMNMQIVGFRIDGVDYTDKRKNALISKLHQRDTATIRDFIDDVSPGIDTTIEVTCQNEECGKDSSVPLPFSENFFRPSK
jgi:hypothetical protein